MTEDELLQGMIIDLRRGTLVLAVLCSLGRPQYGYSLLQHMEGLGIRIEANTLYPLLRRLDAQGLLSSEWDTSESRPRKFYVLSPQGRIFRGRLRNEWRRMVKEMENIVGREQEDARVD